MACRSAMGDSMRDSLRSFLRRLRPAFGVLLVGGSVLLAAAAATQAANPFWDALLGKLGHVKVDPERVLAQQPELIKRAIASLAPQRPGVTDLYFVGLAGDYREAVFRREVASVTRLFDNRFGTKGRSLTLVNSPQTIATLPLATPRNLRRILAQIGGIMDREQDVLLLFLTSHGAPDEFWIDAGPVDADPLSSDDLKEMLNDSGIKWRVLVISACHSGSFINELWDAHTLLITAAREDRTSFGCSSERDWTYFGEAYFDRALRHELSFVTAFDQAEKAIAQREKQDDLTPSLPQMRIGRLIGPKLAELERTVRALPQAASIEAP